VSKLALADSVNKKYMVAGCSYIVMLLRQAKDEAMVFSSTLRGEMAVPVG
jgi:hypothetical protein